MVSDTQSIGDMKTPAQLRPSLTIIPIGIDTLMDKSPVLSWQLNAPAELCV